MRIGDVVEVRDRGHCPEWKTAHVTSVSPLKVKVEGWSWSTTWHEVRPKGIEVLPAPRTPSPIGSRSPSPTNYSTGEEEPSISPPTRSSLVKVSEAMSTHGSPLPMRSLFTESSMEDIHVAEFIPRSDTICHLCDLADLEAARADLFN